MIQIGFQKIQDTLSVGVDRRVGEKKKYCKIWSRYY